MRLFERGRRAWGRDISMRKRKYSSLTALCPDCGVIDSDCPLPSVHNIVATSKIVSSLPTLDLNRIHALLPFSFYDQNKFAAITVRLHQPNCTTLLFSSGKLVVTGCRSWYQCVYASLFIADTLSQCIPGHSFSLQGCEVQNMVAHVETPVGNGYLDLHGMYARMAINCTYQRKMFPGLIYRPEASPVVLLCFFSGKIVVTGGKTMHDVYTGWFQLWPILKQFLVVSSPPKSLQEGVRRTAFRRVKGKEMGLPDIPTCHKDLPLEGDTVAGYSVGGSDELEEPAGCDAGRPDILDLLQPAKLESLCDDLAAKGPTLQLRGGVPTAAC